MQSAVCLSKCLVTASVFLLGATRHFVLLSCNAPINVNPVGGGGGEEVLAKGGDLTNLKIF